MTTTRTASRAAALTIALIAGSTQAQLFGVDAFSTGFGTIDSTNASWSLIGNSGAVLTGLAYQPSQNAFFGVSPSTDSLYRVNETTGQATLIGALGNGYDNVNALAFDPGRDLLFATDNNTNSFFTISTTSGQATTPIAFINNGFTEIEDLAFDPTSGRLYGITAVQNAIVEINTRTGDTQLVANLPGAVWRGMTWDTDRGSLVLSAVNIFNDAGIYRFDLGAGELTQMGNTIGIEAIQGLAYRSVPAPTTLALLGLAGLAGTRRRR